jgi:hypothetical protein
MSVGVMVARLRVERDVVEAGMVYVVARAVAAGVQTDPGVGGASPI